MPSITPMMSAILAEAWRISPMVCSTSCISAPPRSATVRALPASASAWVATSALWRTVPAICSIDEAVACRLLAACSVRWLRSVLPAATSWLDIRIVSLAWRTCPTSARS